MHLRQKPRLGLIGQIPGGRQGVGRLYDVDASRRACKDFRQFQGGGKTRLVVIRPDNDLPALERGKVRLAHRITSAAPGERRMMREIALSRVRRFFSFHQQRGSIRHGRELGQAIQRARFRQGFPGPLRAVIAILPVAERQNGLAVFQIEAHGIGQGATLRVLVTP